MNHDSLKRRETRDHQMKFQTSQIVGKMNVRVKNKAKNQEQILSVKELLLEYNAGIDFDILTFDEETKSVEYVEVRGVYLANASARVYKIQQTQKKDLEIVGTWIQVMTTTDQIDPRNSWTVGSLVTPVSSVLILSFDLISTRFEQNWIVENLDTPKPVYEILTFKNSTIFVNDILIKVENDR